MSSESRLPTFLCLEPQLRQIEKKSGFYTVLRRGDSQSGMILALHRVGRDLYLYQQNRDLDDVLGWWRCAPKGSTLFIVEQAWADAYIQRAVSRDPDLWVVELETRDAAFPLEGPIFDEFA